MRSVHSAMCEAVFWVLMSSQSASRVLIVSRATSIRAPSTSERRLPSAWNCSSRSSAQSRSAPGVLPRPPLPGPLRTLGDRLAVPDQRGRQGGPAGRRLGGAGEDRRGGDPLGGLLGLQTGGTGVELAPALAVGPQPKVGGDADGLQPVGQVLAGELGVAAVLGDADDADAGTGPGVPAVRAAECVPDLLAIGGGPGFRTFRRSVATLIEREAGVDAAQAQLGHEDPHITREFDIHKASLAPNLTAHWQQLVSARTN